MLFWARKTLSNLSSNLIQCICIYSVVVKKKKKQQFKSKINVCLFVCLLAHLKSLTFMLLIGRIIESDRYQDEKDEERPYYLNQQLNLEKKRHNSVIFTHLFKLLDCFGSTLMNFNLNSSAQLLLFYPQVLIKLF